ncbi:SDR family NAD(P)-dependent oxidoreductase [Streptomyces sp. NPDC054804]
MRNWIALSTSTQRKVSRAHHRHRRRRPPAGPAIARTFGSHGLNVALISHNLAKLDDLTGKLAADGITAAAFPADVLDRNALSRAPQDAAVRFGGIDVLEYSPVGGIDSTALTAPSATEPADVQHEMDFHLYGAIVATRAVLPAMREAGAGTLLYTTGAGSIDPSSGRQRQRRCRGPTQLGDPTTPVRSPSARCPVSTDSSGARRPEGMPGPCVLALGAYLSAARAASTPAMGEPRPVTVS